MSRIARQHLVIPDCQVRPGVPIDHLSWIGNYVNEKRPDVVVNLGDFADMHSLSSYDLGKASSEGARYVDDIEATRAAMRRLMKPIKYKPELHFTLGNHEDRIDRHVEANPSLVGALSISDLKYKESGWKVYPFLKVATIDSVEYCHYFISGSMGRPVSSARALLTARHRSAIMGHVQHREIA